LAIAKSAAPFGSCRKTSKLSSLASRRQNESGVHHEADAGLRRTTAHRGSGVNQPSPQRAKAGSTPVRAAKKIHDIGVIHHKFITKAMRGAQQYNCAITSLLPKGSNPSLTAALFHNNGNNRL